MRRRRRRRRRRRGCEGMKKWTHLQLNLEACEAAVFGLFVGD
jgi:hypothetical protein